MELLTQRLVCLAEWRGVEGEEGAESELLRGMGAAFGVGGRVAPLPSPACHL